MYYVSCCKWKELDLKNMDNRKFLPVIIIAAVALIVIFGLSSSIFYTIKAGERAVIFKKFQGGLDKENVISQGFGWKAPWNDL